MSDYRDILLKALQEGKTMDSCGLDERYYDFGLYTDLCGMSVEDAIKSVTQCCCGGGGSNTGGTKTNNPITISAEKNTDNKYVVKVKAAYATTAPVIVSFTIDGQSVTATIPAGASEVTVDGVVLDTQYATIGKIEIATTDEVYKYTAVNSIADGLFVLTYKIDGKTVHELTIKVGTKIEKFEPEAKTGYLFKGWVPAEPETMPEKDVVIEAEFTINSYSLTFKNGTDVVTAFTVEYGAALDGYASQAMALVPAKDGFTFSWDSAVPATMPAEDVVVEGSYKEAKNLVYHGMIKEQDFGTLTQEMVAAFASSDIAENITFTIPADEEYIKRFNIVQFGGESEEEEQEAAAWMREHEKNNTYSFIIAIPSKYANVKFTYVQMDAVINDFVKEANTVMNIGGIEYALWVAHHEMKEENNPYAPRTVEYTETYKLTF